MRGRDRSGFGTSEHGRQGDAAEAAAGVL